MKTIEQIRIRVELSGKTFRDIGELIGLDDPNRAWEFFTGEGAFRELHELRHKARDIVADLNPCPRSVYKILGEGELKGPLAGLKVRWTRIILGYPLRKWSARHGMSTWWWSQFENSEHRARTGLEHTLDRPTVAAIESDMIDAAAKMEEVPSWTTT